MAKVHSINHKRLKVTTPVEHDRNPNLKRIPKNIKQPSMVLVVNLLMRTGKNATFVKSELLKTEHTRKNICKDTHGFLTVVT